jgi:uncharacterized Tic20 family protein
MFRDLLLLEKDRTGKEALGFYLAYLLLTVLLGALAGVLAVISATPAEGYMMGRFAGIIFCIVLSFAILYKKKRLQSFGLVLIVVLSGLGAIFLGGLLGLVPAAYLTTIKKL